MQYTRVFIQVCPQRNSPVGHFEARKTAFDQRCIRITYRTHHAQEDTYSLQHRHAKSSEPFPSTLTRVHLVSIFSNATITARDPNRKSLRKEGTSAKSHAFDSCTHYIQKKRPSLQRVYNYSRQETIMSDEIPEDYSH